MKASYDARAISAIFSELSRGRVTADEFMDAQTPDEVDALLEKAHIPPAVANAVYSAYTTIEGSPDDGVLFLDPRCQKPPGLN
jgi:hypothetical protein